MEVVYEAAIGKHSCESSIHFPAEAIAHSWYCEEITVASNSLLEFCYCGWEAYIYDKELEW